MTANADHFSKSYHADPYTAVSKTIKSVNLHKRKLTLIFIPLVALMRVDQFEESNNVEEKIGSFERIAEYH